jgi:tetratricopeptide (TPR) repeat protein
VIHAIILINEYDKVPAAPAGMSLKNRREALLPAIDGKGGRGYDGVWEDRMKKNLWQAGLIGAAVLAAACFSGPVIVDENASAEEIIQMAQTAMDRNRYTQAIRYYQTVIDRFSNNTERICDAEYGITLVHYKQKKYNLAKEECAALLQKYKAPGGSSLPQKYEVLAKTLLANIAGKQKIIADE